MIGFLSLSFRVPWASSQWRLLLLERKKSAYKMKLHALSSGVSFKTVTSFNRLNFPKMKLSILSVTAPLLAQLVAAIPTPTWDEAEVVEHAQIVKRATITDIATTG